MRTLTGPPQGVPGRADVLRRRREDNTCDRMGGWVYMSESKGEEGEKFKNERICMKLEASESI